jgi:cardiolipin synthase
VWTVPNLISASRFLMVGLFAWLVWTERDAWAVAVLALSGISDWVDGVLARKLNQFSKIGAWLDPAADRAFIIVTVLGLAWRDIIPWWLLAVLLSREIVMGVALLALRRRGFGPMPVEFVGKAATMALMYAFPLLLLASLGGWVGVAAWVCGWAFSLWGVFLYWVACVVYLQRTWATLHGAGRP